MTTIEQIVAEANETDWMKRIASVESIAQIHGATSYEGQFIQDWLRQKLEGLIEEMAGEISKKQTLVIKGQMSIEDYEYGNGVNAGLNIAAQIIRSYNQKV